MLLFFLHRTGSQCWNTITGWMPLSQTWSWEILTDSGSSLKTSVESATMLLLQRTLPPSRRQVKLNASLSYFCVYSNILGASWALTDQSCSSNTSPNWHDLYSPKKWGYDWLVVVQLSLSDFFTSWKDVLETFSIWHSQICLLSSLDGVKKFLTSPILLSGIDYKPLDYKEHNFSEAPKFTTNMPDRCTTVGYTTKLLCAVRGSPKACWLTLTLLLLCR